MTAELAAVEYDIEGLDAPILSVEEAVEKSSFFEHSPYYKLREVRDFSKGMAEADHKILSVEVLLKHILER